VKAANTVGDSFGCAPSTRSVGILADPGGRPRTECVGVAASRRNDDATGVAEDLVDELDAGLVAIRPGDALNRRERSEFGLHPITDHRRTAEQVDHRRSKSLDLGRDPRR
jgi:hypothetical protein